MVLTHLWFGITVECDLSGQRLPLGKSAVFRSTSSACFYEIDETTEHELVSVLARADRLIVVSIVCTENEFTRIDLSRSWFVSLIERASHALCRWGSGKLGVRTGVVVLWLNFFPCEDLTWRI